MRPWDPQVWKNHRFFVADHPISIHVDPSNPVIVKGILRLPFIPFLRGITDAQAVAYSTASSSATLPVTITCAEENLGVDKAVAGSVLPLGATINMDGTAIYIGMVALFGAQALGIEVTLAQYVLVAVMATLVSIGLSLILAAILDAPPYPVDSFGEIHDEEVRGERTNELEGIPRRQAARRLAERLRRTAVSRAS